MKKRSSSYERQTKVAVGIALLSNYLIMLAFGIMDALSKWLPILFNLVSDALNTAMIYLSGIEYYDPIHLRVLASLLIMWYVMIVVIATYALIHIVRERRTRYIEFDIERGIPEIYPTSYPKVKIE